jgi:hypothetical protein
MNVGRGLARDVRRRARDRCEYCRMHQRLQGASFHIEHITPRCLGGPSVSTNLALCCPSCNLHKANRCNANDPKSGLSVSLFNPREMDWDRHFRFEEFRIVGITPRGRATVALLHLNQPRRIRVRIAEEAFGLFPPV